MRDDLVAEARTWLGTPYHHHARVKGAGVDCAQILIAVFAECGVIEAFDPGHYATDWHLHRSEEKYIEWMDRYGVRVKRPEPGDVGLWKFGRTYSHGGIVVPEGVIHAYVERGVIRSRLDEEPLAGREVMFWKVNHERQQNHQHQRHED